MRPTTGTRSTFFGRCGRARKIAGLSLVELMVALTIGLIILAALVRLFATSRSTYTLEEGLARVQESGRFAMEFMAQDIRMAGYAGCSANLSSSVVNNLVSPSANATIFNPDGIVGYKPSCTTCSGALSEWPGLPSSYFPTGGSNISPIGGTDILVIQRGDTVSAQLSADLTTTADSVAILSDTALASTPLVANDVLMISNCQNADVFKATSVTPSGGTTTVAHTTGNTGNDLSMAYKVLTSPQVMKLVTRIYFIGRRGNDANNVPSLYRKELTNGSLTAQELVEGVQTMKLVYGEDTDSDGVANIYRAPASVGSWRNVMAVRIGMLVSTSGNVEQQPDARSYDLAGTTVGPYNDNRRRRAFNATVLVRNHYHY